MGRISIFSQVQSIFSMGKTATELVFFRNFLYSPGLQLSLK